MPSAKLSTCFGAGDCSGGARFLHCQPGTVEPPVSDAIDLVDEDEALVVVNKGAPLPVHPSGRYSRNTLLSILQEAYHPEKLRPCHRLDMNTTGLVVFARRYKYAQDVQQQFAEGTVEKVYRVEVEGSWSGIRTFAERLSRKKHCPAVAGVLIRRVNTRRRFSQS